MAGYFAVGEQKIRPSAYFNVSKKGEENTFGAVDGVVAVLFKSSFGPLGTVKVIEREDGYAQVYGGTEQRTLLGKHYTAAHRN